MFTCLSLYASVRMYLCYCALTVQLEYFDCYVHILKTYVAQILFSCGDNSLGVSLI